MTNNCETEKFDIPIDPNITSIRLLISLTLGSVSESHFLPVNFHSLNGYLIDLVMPEPDVKVEPEEPDDPVESMLKKTGCIELHYKVQVKMEKFLNFLVKFNFIPFQGVHC